MKNFINIFAVVSFLAVSGFFMVPALAKPMGNTAKAGFSGLPPSNCQGMYCAEVKKLALGQDLRINYDDYMYGWAHVEVVGTGQTGWVSDANIF